MNHKIDYLNKIVQIDRKYYVCSDKIPVKGEKVIIQTNNGGYKLSVSRKDYDESILKAKNDRKIWSVYQVIDFLY